MNQTLWIIIGGAVIIAVAVGLYFLSGSPEVSTVPPVETQEAAVANATPEATTPETTTPVANTTETPAPTTEAKEVPAPAGDPVVVLHTTMGNIVIKLYAKDAPKAVANFLELARSGFYDGVKFHRVIKGFMIQSGDPLTKDDTKMSAWGTGGPGYKFENEASGHLFVRGSLGMANSGGTATNGSQFFIVTAPSTPFLDGGYTNFGEVVEGLDIAMKIEGVQTDGSAQMGTGNDRPVAPITITSVEVR